MKKIKYLSFAIIISLLFTACNSKFSLIKRHYTKGFHFAQSKPSGKPVSKEKISQPNHHKDAIKQVEVKNSEACDELMVQLLPTAPKVLTRQAKTTGAIKENSLRTAVLNHEIPVYSKKNWGISTVGSGNDDDEGRSLFWVVILIIVILWALGLLTGSLGLGVLFNLLLVIALILLILWLLRII